MFLAKVVGTVWSTKKTPDLEAFASWWSIPYDLEKEPTRNIVIVLIGWALEPVRW